MCVGGRGRHLAHRARPCGAACGWAGPLGTLQDTTRRQLSTLSLLMRCAWRPSMHAAMQGDVGCGRVRPAGLRPKQGGGGERKGGVQEALCGVGQGACRMPHASTYSAHFKRPRPCCTMRMHSCFRALVISREVLDGCFVFWGGGAKKMNRYAQQSGPLSI